MIGKRVAAKACRLCRDKYEVTQIMVARVYQGQSLDEWRTVWLCPLCDGAKLSADYDRPTVRPQPESD